MEFHLGFPVKDAWGSLGLLAFSICWPVDIPQFYLGRSKIYEQDTVILVA